MVMIYIEDGDVWDLVGLNHFDALPHICQRNGNGTRLTTHEHTPNLDMTYTLGNFEGL